MGSMSEASSHRSRIHRHPERRAYDAATINPILDLPLICHVAVVDPEGGAPHLIPTIHTRLGDTLCLHGSNALARSASKSSTNYRSVVVFGTARSVTDRTELLDVSRALADHVAPGRGDGDLSLPIWAGVLPLRTAPGEPRSDPVLPAHVQPPAFVTEYRRPGDTR